jgi:hypothetical protein
LGPVVALTFAALFFHVAHGADLKIDGTSKETFERSTKAMADTLSNADREIFASGLLNLILNIRRQGDLMDLRCWLLDHKPSKPRTSQ